MDTEETDILPGGAIDMPDSRDHLAEQVLGSLENTILPERVLLSLLEGNQAAQSATKVACTCFASYHVAEIANELESGAEITPDFITGWNKQGEFGTRIKEGDYVQTALKSVVKNGLILKDGTVKKIKGYALIDKADIKSWLARGFAIVTSSVVTHTNFANAKKTGKWTGADGPNVGGHAFCLVGYEPGFIRASNSYGPNWGFFKDGTFLIPDALLKDLGSCYVLYDEKDMENVEYYFKDVTDRSPMAEEIKFCKDTGIMTGYQDGRFGPNDMLTRAQAAVLVKRIVEYLKKG